MGNEMYHYGVLGMRWGVRRTARQLGRAHRRRAKEREEDRQLQREAFRQEVESRSAKRAAIRDMTDEELGKTYNRLNLEKNVRRLLDETGDDSYTATLNQKISRIKLEREYSSLTAPQKTAGQKFLEDVLPSVGKTAVGTVATIGLTKAVSKALNMSSKEASKLVTK